MIRNLIFQNKVNLKIEMICKKILQIKKDKLL